MRDRRGRAVRRPVVRRILLVLLAVTAAATTVGRPAAASKPVAVQGAKFSQLPPGWRAFDADFTYLTRRGASINTYALSWRYRPKPSGWAPSMPRNGIAVSVILIRRSIDPAVDLCRRAPHDHGFPARSLPLKLPKAPSNRLDGAPNVLEYRIFGRLDESYNVDLRVEINSVRPSPAMLRTAQTVVSRIRFPVWPNHC
jgi:hypothetical protein